MPPPGRELSTPRAWFLTVRMLEVGGAALLTGASLEIWTALRMSDQLAQLPPGSTQSPASLTDRVVGFALYGASRGPLSTLVCAVVIGACLLALHRAQPVSHARVLRWELLALWAGCGLLTLVYVASWVVALFGDDPFQSASTEGTYQGPNLVEQAIGGLAWPLATALVLAAVAVWWLRLPAEFVEDVEDVGPQVQDAGHEARWRRLKPVRASEPAAPAREPDDIVLDGVEQIEPVDRLKPRAGSVGDGSTSSGYDDYFRRF